MHLSTRPWHDVQDQGERERVERGRRDARPIFKQNLERAVRVEPVNLHQPN